MPVCAFAIQPPAPDTHYIAVPASRRYTGAATKLRRRGNSCHQPVLEPQFLSRRARRPVARGHAPSALCRQTAHFLHKAFYCKDLQCKLTGRQTKHSHCHATDIRWADCSAIKHEIGARLFVWQAVLWAKCTLCRHKVELFVIWSKEFPTFCGTRRFVTLFTTACQLCLS